ncbi:hypothetical protein FB45DRAFT_862897 [Roridomyces roridus]|uniref:Uncharacterized protein n=1 Tax=Roridomyces roridus TaxID=1738132 RepID=A0AAD7FT81_9AGAR|nr:hypothetical protein FB45DRAFT_862897 [Roridomyces roridus]
MSSGNDPLSSHRRLLLKGHGYPLYASKDGVQIGDVGVVTRDCSFDVFFNIYEPATRGGVPHGFKVVSVDNSEDNLVSQVFPDGTSRTDLASVSLTASRERALKQGESWYDFVREQVEIGRFGSGVQNGELYVITGVKNAQSTTAESQNMFIRGFKIAVRSLPSKLNNDETLSTKSYLKCRTARSFLPTMMNGPPC